MKDATIRRVNARSPYRPMPLNFAELFIRFGWGGIKEELHAHRRSIKRWLVQAGEEDLRRRRRAYLEARYAAQGKKVPGAAPSGRS